MSSTCVASESQPSSTGKAGGRAGAASRVGVGGVIAERAGTAGALGAMGAPGAEATGASADGAVAVAALGACGREIAGDGTLFSATAGPLAATPMVRLAGEPGVCTGPRAPAWLITDYGAPSLERMPVVRVGFSRPNSFMSSLSPMSSRLALGIHGRATLHLPAHGIPSRRFKARRLSLAIMPPSLQSPPSSMASRVDDSVFAIKNHTTLEPRVGVVLGSGLGGFADHVDDLLAIPYGSLPHMPTSSVPGHAGRLCFGRVRGVPVVCMQGRCHLYEGQTPDNVVHGVRTMARLGARTVLLTNAAGGLEPSWAAGDLMVISDHLNLTGHSPLLGPNDDGLGPRFPDMTSAYDPRLRAILHEVAHEKGLQLREGVYAGLLGPSYETPAEVKMVRTLGAQAVGMSTVLEVIALRHMGIRVGALSCITNLAAGLAGRPLDHAEVEAVAQSRRPELMTLLAGWIAGASALS